MVKPHQTISLDSKSLSLIPGAGLFLGRWTSLDHLLCFSRNKGFEQERYGGPFLQSRASCKVPSVCTGRDLFKALWLLGLGSGAEKAGMSSGSRLPKAQADTGCLFVYLREFWPHSYYFIAGSLLKYKDNDMFEKCLKRQLAGIETTPGSCFFMSLC